MEMKMTTSTGEPLTSDERLELESLREVWRTLKPFLATFSLSVVLAQLDSAQSREAMNKALSHYGPMSEAVIAYASQFDRPGTKTVTEAVA